MTLGKTRDPDSESSRVRVHAGCVELPDVSDEIRRFLKCVLTAVVRGTIARRIAAEGQDVAHPGRRVPLEDLAYLRLGVAHAREVRHGLDRCRAPNPDHQLVRQIPRRTSRAVRHRNERRLQRLELADGLEERLRAELGLRREEFEGAGGSLFREDGFDVHERPWEPPTAAGVFRI